MFPIVLPTQYLTKPNDNTAMLLSISSILAGSVFGGTYGRARPPAAAAAPAAAGAAASPPPPPPQPPPLPPRLQLLATCLRAAAISPGAGMRAYALGEGGGRLHAGHACQPLRTCQLASHPAQHPHRTHPPTHPHSPPRLVACPPLTGPRNRPHHVHQRHHHLVMPGHAVRREAPRAHPGEWSGRAAGQGRGRGQLLCVCVPPASLPLPHGSMYASQAQLPPSPPLPKPTPTDRPPA